MHPYMYKYPRRTGQPCLPSMSCVRQGMAHTCISKYLSLRPRPAVQVCTRMWAGAKASGEYYPVAEPCFVQPRRLVCYPQIVAAQHHDPIRFLQFVMKMVIVPNCLGPGPLCTARQDRHDLWLIGRRHVRFTVKCVAHEQQNARVAAERNGPEQATCSEPHSERKRNQECRGTPPQLPPLPTHEARAARRHPPLQLTALKFSFGCRAAVLGPLAGTRQLAHPEGLSRPATEARRALARGRPRASRPIPRAEALVL